MYPRYLVVDDETLLYPDFPVPQAALHVEDGTNKSDDPLLVDNEEGRGRLGPVRRRERKVGLTCRNRP